MTSKSRETRTQWRHAPGTDETYQFTWTKAQGGYEVADYKGQRTIWPRRGRFITWYPLESSEWAFSFAGVSDEATICEFASKYGWLGWQKDPQSQSTNRDIDGIEEDVRYWLRASAAFRRALELWESLRSGKDSDLRKHVTHRPLQDLYPHSDLMGSCIEVTAAGVSNFLYLRDILGKPKMPESTWKLNDLRGPVLHVLTQLVNDELEGSVSLTMNLELRQCFRPANLRACIWLIFLHVITGVRKIRNCELCGGLLDVTDCRSHKRTHSRCSGTERTRRYRKKIQAESSPSTREPRKE